MKKKVKHPYNRRHSLAALGEKTCLVTKQAFPKQKMLRFTVFNKNNIVFDVYGKLPGRGIWIQADPALVQQAIDKKLFSKGARQGVIVPTDLVQQIGGALEKRCLSLLHLARRAGVVHTGFEAVKKLVTAGQIRVAFEARDGSEREQSRLFRPSDPFLVCRAFSRIQLGEITGTGNTVHIAVTDHPLAEELVAAVEKMMPFLGAQMNERITE